MIKREADEARVFTMNMCRVVQLERFSGRVLNVQRMMPRVFRVGPLKHAHHWLRFSAAGHGRFVYFLPKTDPGQPRLPGAEHHQLLFHSITLPTTPTQTRLSLPLFAIGTASHINQNSDTLFIASAVTNLSNNPSTTVDSSS